MRTDTILVFNFGGQYCHLIARRIRDSGVYSEIVQSDLSLEKLRDLEKKLNIKGIILSGGPSSIYEPGAPKMDKRIVSSGIPILGICYGHQLLAKYLNCNVLPAEKKEYGPSNVRIDIADGVLQGLSKNEPVWMSHGDSVLSTSSEVESLAHTENCPIAAFMHKTKPIFGVQWHPEVLHTKHGDKILANFVFAICKSKKQWNPEKTMQEFIFSTEKAANGKKAIIALSGGVDSSTAAAIASRAIGNKLTAVFVDTGFMREGEPAKIKKMAEKLGINLLQVDASKAFISKLKGVSDPEQKRKIIGNEFIKTFEEVAEELNADYLIQGTIYPDRIESGHSKESNVIKTHHNVGGIPEKIKFKGIIEPLKDLYKDEVRKLAIQLGIPKEMVHRQPFPGPGLAVRIIGSIDDRKLNIIRKAESIVSEEIERYPRLRNELWQYFAVLTETRSTGVKGDARSYGYVVAIRTVESREAMTANFAKIDYKILDKISTRITGEIPEVVRVVYDVTNKPPATIEWE